LLARGGATGFVLLMEEKQGGCFRTLGHPGSTDHSYTPHHKLKSPTISLLVPSLSWEFNEVPNSIHVAFFFLTKEDFHFVF
jgi:hypothetical protein